MQLSDRKTIALVANTTWNIYNFRLNLIRTFIRQGYQVVVIAPVDAYIRYLNEIEGVRHIELARLERKTTDPFKDIRLLWQLIRIYKQIRPSFTLHFTIKPNIYGTLAARWLDIPAYNVVTGLGYTFLHGGWLSYVTARMYRFAFRSARRVIFENEDDRELFIERGLVQREQTARVPGCGVDVAQWKPSFDRAGKHETVFLFVGRLLYDKGIRELIDAARIIQKSRHRCSVWVLGEVDEGNPSFIPRADLLRWMEEGIIRYFGYQDDVMSLMLEADCIVLPSYREGLSKVLLEALALGKPVITTQTAGCQETVSHGRNGWLVPVRDSNALALAMEAFLARSPDERLSMGRASRKLALARYTDEHVAQAFIELINDTTEVTRVATAP